MYRDKAGRREIWGKRGKAAVRVKILAPLLLRLTHLLIGWSPTFLFLGAIKIGSVVSTSIDSFELNYPSGFSYAYAELRRELGEEKKKCHSRDHMPVRMKKWVHMMFMCASPTKNILEITRKNVDELFFLNETEKKGSNALSLRDEATTRLPSIFFLWLWIWISQQLLLFLFTLYL